MCLEFKEDLEAGPHGIVILEINYIFILFFFIIIISMIIKIELNILNLYIF